MSEAKEDPEGLSPTTNALVTGASGFVGQALCSALRNRGVTVAGLGRQMSVGPWEKFHALDIAANPVPPSIFEGVDTVFHLAGKAHAMDESAASETEYLSVNTEGTRRILHAAQEAEGVRKFIFVSTVKASSNGDPYGTSKRLAEGLVLAAAAKSSLHVVVLRPALIYGPNWKGNLRLMETSVRGHRFPPLPELGNKRSMIHVDDVVDAALLVAERKAAGGKTYVLTDGESYSTRRIYLALCAALGRKVPPWTVPVWILRIAARLGDVAEKVLRLQAPIDSAVLSRLVGSEVYDGSTISQECSWQPRRKLEDTIATIVVR